MTEHEPIEVMHAEALEAVETVDAPDTVAEDASAPVRRKRWPRVVMAVAVALVAVGAGFYFLGAPSQGQAVSENGQAVPPADPNSPLAISIPGCVCHSDDPAQVAEHKQYRMNQCAGCHMDGVPEMAQ